MFKRLKKSVIDKNKLLLTNLSNKRINKTPSKIIYPNRTNLTFANIIVNMNSTPSFTSIDSWNNSYFNTELNSNSFSKKSFKKICNDITRNTSETKDDHSDLLSIIINGILCLKSNELLNYCTYLIEIIIYLREKKDKYNYIDINSEMNKDLLMIIYQIYFQIFPKNSYIDRIIRNDLKNNMKIFKKIHSIYILYILSGLSYSHEKLKSNKTQFYNFLKRFIKKEKCSDLKCPICIHTENFDKNASFINKPSVIKIIDKKYKKNININSNRKKFDPQIKKSMISISNDNIINKNRINNIIQKNYYSNKINESSKNKNIFSLYKSINDLNDMKKKIFYSQIIGANEKEKNKFFNHSSNKNKMRNNKIKFTIYKKVKNDNTDDTINNMDIIDIKKYNTEKNKNTKNKITKIEGKFIDEIKAKLNKTKINNNLIKITKKKIKNPNKTIDINDINNNKIIEINKNNKNKISKTKKIKINLFDSKVKNEKKINIILDNSEKNNIINNNNIQKKETVQNHKDINESSKIIKANINIIEKELIAFKEHNLFIKQQLEKMYNKNN